MKLYQAVLFLCTVLVSSFCAAREPQTFFIDSVSGQDDAAGTSEKTAWQSLDRVNKAELIPGDKILFKKDGLWRGQLKPRSGEQNRAILYSSYGKGEKPILQGSVSRDDAGDWSEVKPGIWATSKFEPQLVQNISTPSNHVWGSSFQNKAKGSLTRVTENGLTFNRLVCGNSGEGASDLQLWGPRIQDNSDCIAVRMLLRASKPFTWRNAEFLLPGSPWSLQRRCTMEHIKLTPEWQGILVYMMKSADVETAALHFSLGGQIPGDGTTLDFIAEEICRADASHCQPIRKDVGILILDHGKEWGIKKWSLDELKKPLDYWYDGLNNRVFVAMSENPAKKYQSVELALTQHVINEGGVHDVIYDGLAVRYGAAHGFGGGSTKRLVIRNCDVYWIGGGLQHFNNSRPVRYGNGIEFWNGAEDHIVENNRIWEIYDAALTNQGSGDDSKQRNIVYRNNVIWNSEYSFEYWNRPASAITENILFENNICVDAGFGWAHNQRPDPNGAHMMFYNNSAMTRNVVIRNNHFIRSTEVCMRMENDWTAGLTMENNIYWQESKPVIRWIKNTWFDSSAKGFSEYREKSQLDKDSIFRKPVFRDEGKRDYRVTN